MRWIRGLIFTALVPLMVAYGIPTALYPGARPQGGVWDLGWALIALGTFIYCWCLLGFLLAGGTPAIFFTRPLRALIGEEPSSVVSTGMYRFSRNPMYVGVLLTVFGEAILFRSHRWAIYGATVFVLFHLVVVVLEEPHLRATRGASYEEYCRKVQGAGCNMRTEWSPTRAVSRNS